MIIFYLALPFYVFIVFFKEHKESKERKNLVESVANKLLELADDEKPIMLNVQQDKLIEKTVDEIELRRNIQGRM